MTDINGVVLGGRLTADCKYSVTPGGMGVAKFSIANSRAVKKKDGTWTDEASYFDCVLFGKSAENLSKYLLKGKPVTLQGTVRQDRWEKDGNKYSRIYFVVDNIQLHGTNAIGQNGTAPAPQMQAQGEKFDDDGIPF